MTSIPDFCPGCELPKAHVDTCGSPNCYWKANIAGRETKAWHVERARAEADYSIGAGVPEHLEGVIEDDVVAKLRVEAQGEADADRLFTDARFGKHYHSRRPEQTLRWKAADLIESQARLLSERESKIERLTKAGVTRPGVFCCPKCELRWYASRFTQDGDVAASRTAECLNGCGPGWGVAWKDECVAAEARAESAEARLQQARHTLSLFAEMADFPGDPKVAAVLRGYRDAARTTLAAIQGDT